MSQRFIFILALFSLISIGLLYTSGNDVVKILSPQGCRMSWMSPSYVLQSGFNTSWTPLARRYSLWLYREVGWEHDLHGQPVLFIPGNAGSSHQVRSIASSATRQFYSSPSRVSDEFISRRLKPLDFFAVEFNEDLSAFHGTTLDSERRYSAKAIDYILSLYPPNTSIIVLGHSMGGIVATSLLPQPNISAIITMSTPHTLPPARFDSRIDHIYGSVQRVLKNDPTPILSLCGGATDLMVPSESCILPQSGEGRYRRTIFSSALEGSWTGVGHQEMVWCHQVRWRVARATLELGAASSPSDRGEVLDTWLRDGSTLPPRLESHLKAVADISLRPGQFITLQENERLDLRSPAAEHTYLLPVPKNNSSKSKFVLYLSQGSIPPTAPHRPLPLRASVRICRPNDSAEREVYCTALMPSKLRLIPNPIPGRPFPVPGEGSDESEGVVFFEAGINVPVAETNIWVGLSVEGADGRGWLVGAFVQTEPVINMAASSGLLFSSASIDLPPDSLYTRIIMPSLLSHALIVYKLTPHFESPCSESRLLPLLQHTSHPSESHYFPLSLIPPRNILLHSHTTAPYTARPARGFNLTIHSSGECTVTGVNITIDWWSTLGRWGVRYWSAVLSWAVGLVAWLIFDGWSIKSDLSTSIGVALSRFVERRLTWFALASFVISLLPLPVGAWLGNSGEPIFALLAPFLLLISTGLVSLSLWILRVSVWFWQKIVGILPFARRSTPMPVPGPANKRHLFISMAVVFLIIFLIVPWQVAFLGCWIFQFYTCSTASQPITTSPSAQAIPLMQRSPSETDNTADDENSILDPNSVQQYQTLVADIDRNNQSNEYVLLLMTWLLPLAAPVLAVWVRTLATAGLTTPFDGDHNVFYVAPFLLLLDIGPVAAGFLHSRSDGMPISRWAFLLFSMMTFFWGPRSTYIVFYAASTAFGITLLAELLPHYWTKLRYS